ncbi:MAG: hypothetical protein WCW14_02155 [Candidatus Paceibacterota bacterium]
MTFEEKPTTLKPGDEMEITYTIARVKIKRGNTLLKFGGRDHLNFDGGQSISPKAAEAILNLVAMTCGLNITPRFDTQIKVIGNFS